MQFELTNVSDSLMSNAYDRALKILMCTLLGLIVSNSTLAGGLTKQFLDVDSPQNIETCIANILAKTTIDGVKEDAVIDVLKSWCNIARGDWELDNAPPVVVFSTSGSLAGLAYDHGKLKNQAYLMIRIDLLKYPIEAIDFVLAHELGHFRLHHALERGLKQRRDQLFQAAVVGASAVAARSVVGIGTKSRWIKNSAAFTGGVVAYSLIHQCMAYNSYVENENEADSYALKRLHELGLDAKVSAQAFIDDILPTFEKIEAVCTKDLARDFILEKVKPRHPSPLTREKSITKTIGQLPGRNELRTPLPVRGESNSPVLPTQPECSPYFNEKSPELTKNCKQETKAD
jgi:Zn-dependent protease with chaperone function